jgi:hypothetical protein
MCVLRKDIFLTGSITNVEIQGEIAVRRNSQSMLSLKVGYLFAKTAKACYASR